jgi:predicted DNA-binding transcriptional regulator YafY
MKVEEKIRNAGNAHKLIEITARKKDGTVTRRVVEPYNYRALAKRRGEEGDKLLICYDLAKQGYRSFSVDNILDVRVLDSLFEPREKIQL